MEHVKNKFLRYVKLDTQSSPESETYPSTDKQKELGRLLVSEMQALGLVDVHMDKYGYVFGTIPSNLEGNEAPVIGFIAHQDTAPDYSGKDVKPRIVESYSGGEIMLNEQLGICMSPQQFPTLTSYIGKDLIVTDGTTLLGADDKAGIAIILAMAEQLMQNPDIPHGEIRLGFTVDEEIGRGVDHFDVTKFGATFAFTVDGGSASEISYENFHAASANITIHGAAIHPGTAKHRMLNSQLLAMELHQMLPIFENPMYTENYEGFFHLTKLSGDVEETRMTYIIRDHDDACFEQKKERLQKIADYLNDRYPSGTVELEIKESYRNMKEILDKNPAIIGIAKKAMREVGIEPVNTPIRGGTDGSNLSYMGLPCPNLGTGSHNAHGKYEFACVQSMEQLVALLVKISTLVSSDT